MFTSESASRTYNDEVVAPFANFACEVKRRFAARREAKKRHVETVTRLPTKLMATACWASIVAKSPPLETAPRLRQPSLQPANIKIINNLSTESKGQAVDDFLMLVCPRRGQVESSGFGANRRWEAVILSARAFNPVGVLAS
ncbi:hypothetical protein [Pelomonas sp. KK5]|uniref:hypothetical protein n=1 Tax=Pelomonas sp. KK5 TaxID=1855730 RepID=UPI00117E8F98|nr:hypothetical protein [Pelomonas sp. KK5]